MTGFPALFLALILGTCITFYFYYLRYETVKDVSVCGSTSQLFSMSLRDRAMQEIDWITQAIK
jgi:hypothetical protein